METSTEVEAVVLPSMAQPDRLITAPCAVNVPVSESIDPNAAVDATVTERHAMRAFPP